MSIVKWSVHIKVPNNRIFTYVLRPTKYQFVCWSMLSGRQFNHLELQKPSPCTTCYMLLVMGLGPRFLDFSS
jgi:hypothetical protein